MTDTLNETKLSENSGFTLLEVIIALAIMVLAFTSILSIEGGSINATARGKKMIVVGMLAKNQMIEQEFKIQGKTFDEVPKEESGTFEEPYADFRWKTAVKEIEFPKITAGGKTKPGGDDGTDQFTDTISKLVTNFLSKAIREITVTILWNTSGDKTDRDTKKDQSFSLTTYWVDLNYELSLNE